MKFKIGDEVWIYDLHGFRKGKVKLISGGRYTVVFDEVSPAAIRLTEKRLYGSREEAMKAIGYVEQPERMPGKVKLH